jgi:hypothetical protein
MAPGNGRLGSIRIRTLELPRLVQELIEAAVGAQPDMEIVDGDWPPPDFIVCPVPSAQHSSVGRSLLATRARVRVLELDADAGRASMYSLNEQELGEVSPAEIVDMIRAAARGTT